MSRVRHCIACPKCHTRYVISRTPYGNGAYVIPAMKGTGDEYILYCSCSARSIRSSAKSNEVMLCYVVKAAYDRGYGTAREITPVDPSLRERWPVHVGTYLGQWTSPKKNSV